MGSFLAELRRRHIYRIGAVYVVAAWGVAQVVDLLSQTFALPDWIAQPLLIVLAVGLPFTLIAAWMIVGAANASERSAESLRATATDWVLASALVIVIGLIGYQQLSANNIEVASNTAPEDAAADIAEEIVEEIVDRLPNSVAVLPFENLSPDPNDAYFAAGVHGEILSHLSKLRNLSVIARASVLQYEGSDMSIPEIADELNVEMVMAGSVRYAGDRVRVMAELIDGATNLPVWTDQNDGELSDIFAIQSDIAMSIANSLEAEFSVDEQERIETPPTDSPEAYALYLKAQEIRRTATLGDSAARLVVQNLLDDALELDPMFALAHVAKAFAYRWARGYETVSEENWLDFRTEMSRLITLHAETALTLDPSLADAHAVLALEHRNNRRLVPFQEAVEQALQLRPNDTGTLIMQAWVEENIRGRPEEAIRYRERRIELDPNSDAARLSLGMTLHFAGRYVEASEAIRQCLELAPQRARGNRALAAPEMALGNDEAAFDALGLAEQLTQGPGTLGWIAYGYGLLGQSEDAQRVFERLSAMAVDEYVDPVFLAMAHMGVGEYDEALNQLNLAADNPNLVRGGSEMESIRRNLFSDPTLEQPEFVEVRNRFNWF